MTLAERFELLTQEVDEMLRQRDEFLNNRLALKLAKALDPGFTVKRDEDKFLNYVFTDGSVSKPL